MAHRPTSDRGNQSSLYEKLDPELRDKLDRAIVERRPASLQDCYNDFDLKNRGISRAAFYRYAQRLRKEAELHHVAELVHPNDPDAGRYATALINRRLLDHLLNDENASPASIHRLTIAAAKAARSAPHESGEGVL